MRAIFAFGVVGFAVLTPGCALVADGTRLVCYETTKNVSECRERARNRKWAKEAWAEVCRACPGRRFSDDYARGFQEGFENFVYRGGSGEPPVMAPPRYRALQYQTLDGYRAVEDWFAGYRRGTAAAHDGGYRQWVTGPSALRSLPPPGLPRPDPAPELMPEEPLPYPRPTGAGGEAGVALLPEPSAATAGAAAEAQNKRGWLQGQFHFEIDPRSWLPTAWRPNN